MKFSIWPQSKLVFIILFVFVGIFNIKAQEKYNSSSKEIIDLITESNSHYSTDDQLINGCIYPLPDSRRKGDPYLNDQWNEATIFIAQNKYPNQLIKYDIVIGDIVLKAEFEDDVPKLINLNKFNVDSFKLGNSTYINSRILQVEDEDLKYFELIHHGKFSLYKEYKKIFIKEYNNITPHGKYSSIKTVLFLFKDNSLNSVNRKSSFLENFEKEKQNEIKTFMKKNKINYSKASNEELKQLMIFCNKTSSN